METVKIFLVIKWLTITGWLAPSSLSVLVGDDIEATRVACESRRYQIDRNIGLQKERLPANYVGWSVTCEVK
jgi:hypothetical protein